MSLISAFIRRAADTVGDKIRMLHDVASDEYTQAVALVDEDGNQVPPDYGTNDVDEASPTITYVGKETASATWLVMKIDTSSGTVIRYASLLNNALVATYAAAWAARATTLIYGTYSEAL